MTVINMVSLSVFPDEGSLNNYLNSLPPEEDKVSYAINRMGCYAPDGSGIFWEERKPPYNIPSNGDDHGGFRRRSRTF
jgi:hypothetical protein